MRRGSLSISWEFELDGSVVADNNCNAIREADLTMLLNLFCAIVNQLPRGSVLFCLVDCLSAYENSDRKDDTIVLMQKLARLVRKSTRIAFKLVTSPGRSMYIRGLVSIKKRLDCCCT